MKREKIAIIGSGIAGLGSAYFLHDKYDVTIYEKDGRPGGHAYTVTVNEGRKQIPIDTAVMVYNQANYPYFCRLLKELDVPTTQITGTISFQHMPTKLEYAVPNVMRIFADRSNLLNYAMYSLMGEVLRFGQMAPKVLADKHYAEMTVAEFARDQKFSQDFLYKYLLPISAILWSADPKIINDFPITMLVRYFKNHHLLGPFTKREGTRKSYKWRSFVGGTQVYRDRLIALFPDALRLGSPVKTVRRYKDRVEVTTTKGKTDTYDRVIFACHADDALAMLADPTADEKAVLGAFQFKANSLTLHTDSSVMPKQRRAWAVFNCRIDVRGDEVVAEQNYYLNDLQHLPTTKDYFMAVGNDESVDPKLVIDRYTFSHPVATLASAKAQARMDDINQGRSYFCGSYTRYAFHEDAFVSALNVCRKITGDDNLWEA